MNKQNCSKQFQAQFQICLKQCQTRFNIICWHPICEMHFKHVSNSFTTCSKPVSTHVSNTFQTVSNDFKHISNTFQQRLTIVKIRSKYVSKQLQSTSHEQPQTVPMYQYTSKQFQTRLKTFQ